jgi:hypothetical protein
MKRELHEPDNFSVIYCGTALNTGFLKKWVSEMWNLKYFHISFLIRCNIVCSFPSKVLLNDGRTHMWRRT